MAGPQKVEVDGKIEFRRGEQTLVGTVTEIHGRLLGPAGVDPGWVQVELDDGSLERVSQGAVLRALDA
jgi:hypothetical protein